MARLTILHLHILTLTLLFSTLPIRCKSSFPHAGNSTVASLLSAAGHLPAGPVEYRPINSTRRVLAPFQLCLQCRCCTANDPSNCSSMPCCFGIDCDLPDKPYGVCSFVPKTCNCTSCV